jgi:polyhydroxybutyrate depolymerase
MSFLRLFLIAPVVALACLNGCSSDDAAPGEQQNMQPVGTGGAGSAGMAAAGVGGGAGAAAGGTASGAAGVAPIAGSGGMIAPPAGGAGVPAAGSGGMSGSGAGTGGGSGASAGAGGSDEPPTCPASSTLEPGESNASIDVGGTMRDYILHVPPGYTGETPVPLLVDLHPLLNNGAFQRGNSGYRAVADREGFIVVWPDGIDNAWNIGPCCTRSRDVDDEGFMRALVDKIKSEACIDPKRVYAAGYSMGGGLSHFLACNAADVFAAVAPAAFDLIEEYECAPSRPITVISFRGTSDFIVPYSGGASTPPTPYPLDPIHFLGAVGTFEKWAELNQCTGTPTAGSGGCQTYTQCAAGVEVTLCTSSGGHVTGDPAIGWPMLAKHPMP